MEREADCFHDKVCRCLDRDKKRSCFILCENSDPLDTSRTHEASVARDQDSGIIVAMRRELTRLYSLLFGQHVLKHGTFWHRRRLDA